MLIFVEFELVSVEMLVLHNINENSHVKKPFCRKNSLCPLRIGRVP